MGAVWVYSPPIWFTSGYLPETNGPGTVWTSLLHMWRTLNIWRRSWIVCSLCSPLEVGLWNHKLIKSKAIECCPLPQTKKQLKSFPGVAAFYQRFIPNFVARSAVLMGMTGSLCPNQVQWTTKVEAAFWNIQQSLGKNIVLHSPDFDTDLTLQTNASERRIGAVLLQGPPVDQHHVAYNSRTPFSRDELCGMVKL